LSFEEGAVRQDSFESIVYYSDRIGLRRFNITRNTLETLHRSNTSHLFSHDGAKGAYIGEDEKGLYISELAHWNPEQVAPDDLNILGFSWTPDDTRIIIQTGTFVGGNNTDDWVMYAYNFTSNQLEIWPWGDCRKLGRHTETHQFALICWADEWMTASDEVIALKWGGDYQAFNPDDYEFLIDPWAVFMPMESRFDAVDHLTFIHRERPAVYSISQVEAGGDIVPIVSVDGPQDLFSVSPSGDLIAYIVACDGSPRKGYCLRVAEAQTGTIIWTDGETFTVEDPRDIAWFDDGKRLVVSGNRSNLSNPSIWLFDVETGNVEEFDDIIPEDTNIGSIVVDLVHS
jgi:hypothetical protein